MGLTKEQKIALSFYECWEDMKEAISQEFKVDKEDIRIDDIYFDEWLNLCFHDGSTEHIVIEKEEVKELLSEEEIKIIKEVVK